MDIGFYAIIVIGANALGAGMALPQAWKILTTGATMGVSPVWAAMSAAVNAWWAVYGIGVGQMSIVPVSVICVIAYLAIAVALVVFAPTGRSM